MEASDRVAEEIEALLGQADQTSLPVVDRQSQSQHQPPHVPHRSLSFPRRTQEHEIISIIDDLGLVPLGVSVAVPRQKKAAKVQIREQWGDDPALRDPAVLVLGLGRAPLSSSGCTLAHGHGKPCPDHRQQCAVGDPPCNAAHQVSMRNGVEVVRQIGVYHLALATFDNREVDPAHCHLGIESTPEAVLPGRQVRLEDRFEYQQHRRLRHAVADAGHRERAFATIGLGYPHAQQGPGPVRLAFELLLQSFQPRGSAFGFNGIEGLSIHPRCAPIGSAAPVGFGEDVPSAHLVP